MKVSVHRLSILLALSLLSFGAVAQTQQEDDSSVNEAVLDGNSNVRFLRNSILEISATLPAGTKITVPKGATPEAHDYRNESGKIVHSSTGFYSQVRITKIAPGFEDSFPQSRIDRLNATAGGLYISAELITIVPTGDIPALVPSEPKPDYLISFEANGRPKNKFTTYFMTRFGDQLNRYVDPESQSGAERARWAAILAELARAANRTSPAPAELFFTTPELGVQYSILFEEQGIVQPGGAWTIAVKGTATRHGFPNVPCAEFVSEQIREAYQRAGFSYREDFNPAKGNDLIWTETSAVVTLANFMAKAGWIPWDSADYRPMTGAPTMHFKATTPGHAYVIAGDDGRFIVDNGSPNGRDLRTTSDRILRLMYLHGVFFLPPGIIPERWDSR